MSLEARDGVSSLQSRGERVVARALLKRMGSRDVRGDPEEIEEMTRATMMWMVLSATLGLAGVGVAIAAVHQDDAPAPVASAECAIPAPVEREARDVPSHGGTSLATTARTTSTLEPAPVRPAPAPIEREVLEDDGEGLRARRLVVTHGIEGREPIDELASVDAIDGERVYAFVDLANTGEHTEVEVIFEHESGVRAGLVELEVPAHVARHRTWAYSSHVREPGNWTLIIRDRAGRTVAAQSFEVR